MVEIIFLIVLAFVWIVFATIQDLRKREVANWINFSLIIFALGFRFFYSLFNGEFAFFYQGLIGLGIFFVIGNLLYYGRMFAGGDAKLMISLGAILPFSTGFFVNIKIFSLFLLLFLFVGAGYGVGTTSFLTIKYFKKFRKSFVGYLSVNKKTIYPVLLGGIVLMVAGFFETLFFYLGIFVFVSPYVFVWAKAVDNCCMIKKVKTSELREGDWLVKNLKCGNKMILASWGGLEKRDISIIKKCHKMVEIRQGIPFVPVFLISFILLVFIYFNNYFDFLWNSFW